MGKGSFERLKQIITKALILRLPDFTKEFVIECDAAGRGSRAVLMQEGIPLAYFSEALCEGI